METSRRVLKGEYRGTGGCKEEYSQAGMRRRGSNCSAGRTQAGMTCTVHTNMETSRRNIGNKNLRKLQEPHEMKEEWTEFLAMLVSQHSTLVQNVNSFTRSKTLELNFTPITAYKLQQYCHTKSHQYWVLIKVRRHMSRQNLTYLS